MLNQLLGASPALAVVREQLSRLLARQAGPERRLPPVLIEGETGTGKGLVAQLIHETGPRATLPFVDVNCAAIPDALLEAELFGYERGAFTDARQAKPGLLQMAHRGTIFLDEIGLMPDALQVKLLKALEQRSIRRLGATRSEPIDVWVLAATSEDLQRAIRDKRFRQDLYHRLAVVTLRLPPLRERGEDILLLARHFLSRACRDYGVRMKTLAGDADKALVAYGWPGNVRELANVMERVVLLSDGDQVTAATLDLPRELRPAAPDQRGTADLRLEVRTTSESTRGTTAEHVDQQIASLERNRIAEALEASGGNLSRAAALLGLPRNTLRYRIERHGLSEPSSAKRRRTSEPGAGLNGDKQKRSEASEDRVEWQRTRVTFLDVQKVDAGGAALDRPRAFEEAAEKVMAFGGRVIEIRDARMMAAFGLDPAENSATLAAHAALTIVNAARAGRSATLHPVPLRIALHTDDVLVGRVDDRIELDADARRAVDRVLADLQAAKQGDTPVVSAQTRHFLDRRFALEPIASASAPDARAFRISGRQDLAHHRAPFVARARELELLEDLLVQAEGGRGQAVLLVGEPGIGKSRLLQEFHHRTSGRAGWLEGHAVSFGRALPFLPLIDLLKRACGVDDGDAESLIGDKIEHALRPLGAGLRGSVPFLRAMLSLDPGDEAVAAMDPKLRRAGMFEAFRQFLLASAAGRPLIVMLEDVHWMDEATTEFLALMAESIESSRMLLCVTQRTGFALSSAQGVFHTRLTMSRLTRQEIASIAAALLGVAALSSELQQLLDAKTGGNPFFVEEVVRSLSESGALERHAETMTLLNPRQTLTVPDTIQDVILARLARLDGPVRHVLHVASVIGREFTRRVLERVAGDTGGTGSIEDSIRALLAAELIQTARVWPEVSYLFRHALTQEVGYQDQGEPQREALHARIGEAVEALYADRLSENFGVLAYHFTRARRWDKAIEYLLAAARRAEQSFATHEALTLYDEAKSAAEQQAGGVAATRTLMAIYSARARLHFVRSDFTRSAEEAERVLPLARLLGDAIAEGEALATMAWASTWGHNLEGAMRFAREALAVAEPAGALGVQGRAHFAVGFVRAVSGVLDESHASLEKAVGLAQAAGDAMGQSLSLSAAGLLRNWSGDYAAAIDLQNRAFELAQKSGRLQPLTFNYFLRGLTLTGKGDYDRAFGVLNEGLALAERVGDEAFRHRLMNCLGWLYAELGDLDQSEALNTISAQIGRRRRDPGTQPNAELNLGEVMRSRGNLKLAQEIYDGVFKYYSNPSASLWMRYRYSIRMFAGLGDLALQRGDLSAARDHSATCLDLATRSASRKHLVKGWRLAGEVARAQREWDRAEEDLRRALGLALTLGNPVQYWQTEISLGHLLNDLKRPQEARQAFHRAHVRMQEVGANLHDERLREAFAQSAELRFVQQADVPSE